MLHRTLTAAALAAIAGFAGPTSALAQDGPTSVTVQPQTRLVAGQTAPFDAPGVRGIRRGRAIPAGYVLVGQRVTIVRGRNLAGAALSFRCPGGKRLKTFGVVGRAGFSATRNYLNRRQTIVVSLPSGRDTRSTGTIYAVCR
jgi:hypothetical protein